MPITPFVPREDWGATEPKYTEPLTPPIEMVIFHCVGKKKCLDKESCIKMIQKLQKKHLSYGLPDILYNFLIGGDGVIYEGRGWETLATKYPGTKFDGKVMDVAYIGPYRIPDKMPPENMMETAEKLVNWGRIKNVLLENSLRSDLDLQTGNDEDEDDGDSASDLEPDEFVSKKELEELHVHLKPLSFQDVLGTQPESDVDDVDQSKVFNPEVDDVPHEM